MRVAPTNPPAERPKPSARSKAAAEQIVDALRTGRFDAVLVPDPESELGFKIEYLLGVKGRMPIADTPAPDRGPHPSLLAALRHMHQHGVLVPELHSTVLGRNVRAAIILPRSFDPDRTEPYAVVSLLPLTGDPIAHQINNQACIPRLEQELRTLGLENAIVVLPDLLEDRDFGSVRRVGEKYLALLEEDVLPYIYRHIQPVPREAERKRSHVALQLPSYMRMPSRVVTSERSESPLLSDFSTPAPRISIREKLERTESAVLAPGYTGYSVSSAKDRGRPSCAKSPPARYELDQIAGFKTPILVLPRHTSAALKRDVDYGIILPTGFRPDAKVKNAVVTVTAPPGTSFDEIVERLSLNGPPSRPGTIVVILDPRAASTHDVALHRGTCRSVMANEILDRLEEDFNADFSRVGSIGLGSDPAAWRAEIEKLEAEPEVLEGAVVSLGNGRWRHLLPSSNARKAFPEAKRIDKTELIPRKMQKQAADRGAFLVPVLKSEAIERDLQIGVYLPPGYDPSSDEKYPVLIMLPGRNGDLHQWTSAGQVIPKLNHMMSGSAQKMIIVIPDNTNSFFVNSPPDESFLGGGPSRNFQDLITKELVDYATRHLKGDIDRMSLAGVSRGGCGAMLAGMDHPGMFKSIASLSGVLSLAERNLDRVSGPDSLSSDHDPLRKLARRGFGPNSPKIYVDVGAHDQEFGPGAAAFASELERLGFSHTFRVLDPEGGKAEHNWNHFGAMFEEWIAWHQEVYGEAGSPRDPFVGRNLGQQILARLAEERGEQLVEQERAVRGLATSLSGVGRKASSLKKAVAKLPEWISTGISREIESIRKDSRAIGADARVTLATAEAHGLMGGDALNEMEVEVESIHERLDSAAIQIAFWASVSVADVDILRGILEVVPEAGPGLVELLAARPELHSSVDALTQKRFLDHLAEHVKAGMVKQHEGPAFNDFLFRIKDRRFDWRTGGYSHATGSCIVLAMKHPGLILDLIAASRKGEDYKVRGTKQYEGDGTHLLRPAAAFREAFRDDPSTSAYSFRETGPAWERAFMMAVVDDLAPSAPPPGSNPARCNSVAVALSKLTGRDIKYNWAFNLRTGDDLVSAMATQDDGSIAMGDIRFSASDRGSKHYHFPVFYDHDPKSNTVAMQDFGASEERISVAGLEFEVNGHEGPSIYYQVFAGIEPYLTIHKEKMRIHEEKTYRSRSKAKARPRSSLG